MNRVTALRFVTDVHIVSTKNISLPSSMINVESPISSNTSQSDSLSNQSRSALTLNVQRMSLVSPWQSALYSATY